MRPMLRLSALAHGRDNNFQLIRLLSAAAVVLFHSYSLTNHWGDEPLWNRVPELNFGIVGVACFFVISGFLVTQSWRARANIAHFVAARALRIYPALAAAVVLTVVLAGLSSVLDWRTFLGHPRTIDYVLHVTTGWEMRHQLPGAFPMNPAPEDVNGSLWTLPIELRLYVAVLIAGVVGLLARPIIFAGVLALALALVTWTPGGFALLQFNPMTQGMMLLFGLGSLACVARDVVPVSLVLAGIAIAVVLADPAGFGRGMLLLPLLAYVTLVAAYHPRLAWPAFNRVGDYSYGVYVYSYPIQQTLVERIPGVEPMPLFALALALTLAVAALSWHCLEAPALRLKSRFSQPT
jgi:peptidoglycan/LPS O-acetylase OafA/YrhL